MFVCLSQVFYFSVSGNDSGAGAAAAGPTKQDMPFPSSQWLGDG